MQTPMRRKKIKTGFMYVLFFLILLAGRMCICSTVGSNKKKKKKGLHLPCKAALPLFFVVAAVALFMGEGKGVLDAIPSVKEPHFFYFSACCFSCVP